jgi:hypothetical protein
MSYAHNHASSAVTLELQSTPTPIYIVGDSHALGFKNLLVRDSFAANDYGTVARYISGLSAADFFAGGALHAKVATYLEGEEVCRDGKPAHLLVEEKDLAIAYAAGRPQVAPLLLIMCGDIDLRGAFLPHLKNDHDLILPFDNPYSTTGKSPMPFDIARRMAAERLDVLLAGIHSLHNSGLVRTYLHTVPPPTLDDARFREIHGFDCPPPTRYKAAALYNHYLKERCAQMGIPIIDVWPEVTENGYLKPEFELDGVHLNKRGNLITLRKLVDHALSNTHSIKNSARYELLHQLAVHAAGGDKEDRPTILSRVRNFFDRQFQSRPKPAPAPQLLPDWVRRESTRFREQRLCQIEVSQALVAKWRGMLDFKWDIGNLHARLDWAGSPILPHNPRIRTAIPPQEMLDDLCALFSSEYYDLFFRESCGSPVTFLNCRPFLSLPHVTEGAGPQSWHRDGCPPGVFRTIIYLTDVDADSGPFEYQDDAGQVHSISGPAGTMLVFDADRWLHRGSPPKRSERRVLDFVVAPRLPDQPLRILWPGFNNHWPGDPFQYSVNGFLASPPFSDSEVSIRPRRAA